jgi:hypothetical protein
MEIIMFKDIMKVIGFMDGVRISLKNDMREFAYRFRNVLATFLNVAKVTGFILMSYTNSVTLLAGGHKTTVTFIPSKGWGKWGVGYVSFAGGFTNMRKFVYEFCGGGAAFAVRKTGLPPYLAWLVRESNAIMVCEDLFSQDTLEFVVEHELAHCYHNHVDNCPGGVVDNIDFEIEADKTAGEVIGFDKAYFALCELEEMLPLRKNIGNDDVIKLTGVLKTRKLAILKEWLKAIDQKLQALPKTRKIPVLC